MRVMASSRVGEFMRCVIQCTHHDDAKNQVLLQQLLNESMRDSSKSDVHETLLISYTTFHVEIDSSNCGNYIRKVGTAYLPTAKVWETIFVTEWPERARAVWC